LNPKPPKTIEDVPFRRQDKRIINSRKKRVRDRKIIRCAIVAGILLILLGGLLISCWATFREGKREEFIFPARTCSSRLDAHFLGPMIIAGVAACIIGIIFILFSTEICQRLNANQKRVKDPEIDSVTNLHEIKHWVDPGTVTARCFSFLLLSLHVIPEVSCPPLKKTCKELIAKNGASYFRDFH